MAVPPAMSDDVAPHRMKRVLVFGWGAAAERVLQEMAMFAGKGLAIVHCISHLAQAGDCDLRQVCDQLGFTCALHDCNDEIYVAAREFAPDFIVSASYRKKLQCKVLELSSVSINFHPSLLPKHRGCWSGFWSVFEGDTHTGVTCHQMVEKFDCGRVLHQERIEMAPDDTAFSIYKKLLPVTAACAKQVFALYFGDAFPAGEEQVGPSSYHFRKLPFDGLIQPEWTDTQVERFIRAMYFPPFDGAAVQIGTERVLVNSLEAYNHLRNNAAATAAVMAEYSVVAATAKATTPSSLTPPALAVDVPIA